MKKDKGIILQLFFCLFIWAGIGYASELSWENISREISHVVSALVLQNNSRVIFIGTEKGLFKTEDKGGSWRLVLKVKGANQKIYFPLEDEKGNIYAATGNGLFLSHNQGTDWKRIFRSNDTKENNCQALLMLSATELYLGTEGGLFLTKDRARSWYKAAGRFKNLGVTTIAFDKRNKNIYLGAEDGVYRIKANGIGTERIYINIGSSTDDGSLLANENEAGESETVKSIFVKNICPDPLVPGIFYLATNAGIYKYDDYTKEWKRLPQFGLIDKEVNFLFIKEPADFYAATRSGIYLYKNEKWESESTGLVNTNIYALTSDRESNLYAATDKGLFKAKRDGDEIRPNSLKTKYVFQEEPTIQELHQAAIKYATIIDPEQIRLSRKQARLKTILPELSLDYEKTISTYSNSSSTRFTTGPWDWGVSLRWNLGDLIWSEQQRLIDSQARFMIQLRSDILDEITKLYFERRRIKIELISENLDQKKRVEKELKLDELAASLDIFTGGYFSKFLEK